MGEEDVLNDLDKHTEASSDDVERGPAMFEHVVLTVGGLKCGCCETGLSKALRQVPGIKDSQLNIVLARVEFDLNTSRNSVEEVISRLHKHTGYTFEHYIQPEGQVLEFVVSNPSSITQAPGLKGAIVFDIEKKHGWNHSMLRSGPNTPIPTKNVKDGQHPKQLGTGHQKRIPAPRFPFTVRVQYDAKQIGARDVFEYYQAQAPNQKLELASATGHPTLVVGAQQTTRACILFVVTLIFTVPVLVFAWAPVNQNNLTYSHVSLALATIVQVIAIAEFMPGALTSLIRSGLFEMDFLISLSTTTAYVFSVVSYVLKIKKKELETGSFFETSTLLVTLILLGRAVSEFARFRAAKSVSIRSLQTQTALLVIPGSGGATREIDARLLQYGDFFMVPPHTKIVTDGKVIYGGSEVDESMITGESIPVAKGLDHMVYAGTTNGSGQLVVELKELPHENSISRIATMVENAELSKPRVQALADKIAGYFVPTIAAIGVSVFLIWVLVDRYHTKRSWQQAVVKALTYAIATLIVSCPCAIGLAVPMVILIAGGTSARFGIIFREPQKLEVARSVTDIVFDKTGTLTTGEMSVIDSQSHGIDLNLTNALTKGLLEGNKHPVAVAVMKFLEKRSKSGNITETLKVENIQSEPGNGVMGIGEDSKLEIRAGNPQWLGIDFTESPHSQFCVTVDGALKVSYRLEDKARHEAAKVIAILADRGFKVHMISGDSAGAVNKIAHTLSIPKSQTKWRQKPVDKQRYIHELQKDGRVVMFCGDGTNDSAALKQADVGVHINHGSDVARGAADIVLMSSRLQDILILLDISKAAYRRIIINFSWSAIYNVVAILMAAGAFVKVRIEPAWAGLGELISVLPVVLIAFQMKWRDYGRKYKALEYEQES
jgi:Cu2+-exporting ATPase